MNSDKLAVEQGRPETARSPTVFDVAREVGCSIATVSRALNQPDRVNEAVRRRILDAVRRLGYLPNGSARALRSSRSRMMGALVPTLSHAIYARLIGSLQEKLASVGVTLLHVEVGYELKRETGQIRLLLEQGVEGLVVVGTHHRPESFKLLRDRDVPFVATYAVAEDAGIPFAGFNNVKAGQMAAQYLTSLGHRKMAMIAGVTRQNDRAADRVKGFRQAAAALGIGPGDIEIIEAPYRMASGEAALRLILDRSPHVTAIFCGSDILAVGAMKECRRRGLALPADLSIVGFDNLEIAEYLTPSLTTIAIPAEAMGERAADFLLATPQDRPLHARVELETQLIVRETSGPPKTDAR